MSLVNKADAGQVLKLESDPALRYDNAQSAAGVYTLSTDTGTFSGTYTYFVDSGNNFKQYTFHPKHFTDGKGRLWRIQQFRKDATVQASLQIGK